MEGFWDNSQKVRTLVTEVRSLQEKRRDLVDAFIRGDLRTSSHNDIARELQRSRRELQDIPFQSIPADCFIAKLGVKEAYREEQRFLERYIDELDLLNSTIAVAPQPTEDDLKMSAAKDRRRRDIQYATELRLGTQLQTLEQIQLWKKEQRLKVLNDDTLTPDEQDERLEQIDAAVEREKKRIRTNVDIFEDE